MEEEDELPDSGLTDDIHLQILYHLYHTSCIDDSLASLERYIEGIEGMELKRSEEKKLLSRKAETPPEEGDLEFYITRRSKRRRKK